MSQEPSKAAVPPLGPVIRFHRRAAGLTQAGLARLAGVGKTVVLDIEKGKRTVRLETLRRVLEALNIRLEWGSPLRQTFEEAEKRASRQGPRSFAERSGGLEEETAP